MIMIKLWKCRRSSLAVIGMLILAGLGAFKGMDVAMAISTICVGVAGANAFEKRGNNNDIQGE
jgi:hypothetical protein